MAEDLMHYDVIIEEALRSVVRRALEQVIENGLPGEHHFYISFRTFYPEVELPDYLLEKYPGEMTIVVQHQYDDLWADETDFGITLSFNGKPEKLRIPYAAVTVFSDPSVNFALQFQGEEDEDDLEMTAQLPEKLADKKPEKKLEDGKTGEVVSLDQFRKK
jgi:hypothetical protein